MPLRREHSGSGAGSARARAHHRDTPTTECSVSERFDRVTDTSGAVIELTLDAAGRVVNSRVISQATNQRR